jgi:hypothetical protein
MTFHVLHISCLFAHSQHVLNSASCDCVLPPVKPVQQFAALSQCFCQAQLTLMQMLTAEIGFERGGSGGEAEGGEAADAAANVAQGQATKATSMGAAIKDFLTTPQVMPPHLPLLLQSPSQSTLLLFHDFHTSTDIPGELVCLCCNDACQQVIESNACVMISLATHGIWKTQDS